MEYRLHNFASLQHLVLNGTDGLVEDMMQVKNIDDVTEAVNNMHIETGIYNAEGQIQQEQQFHDIDQNGNLFLCGSQAQSSWEKIDLQALFNDDYLDLKTYLSNIPGEAPVIHTKLELVIPNLIKPIGMSMLHNGNLVIGERGFRNSVGIFDSLSGNLMTVLNSERDFFNPSDMATLPNGDIAVRDDHGLQMFDYAGIFIKPIHPRGSKSLNGVCYGIKCDSNGNLVTIHTNPNGELNCMTREGEIDVLIIDVGRNTIVEKIELVEVITDLAKSKCRFLESDGESIYVVDLGLNQIYIINRLNSSVKKIGHAGFGLGQFRDAAGIAIDSAGNIVVSDAGNNRLQVFDKQRNFLGLIDVNFKVSRPSGIYLDRKGKCIYVLNLKSNSLSKLSFVLDEY